MCCTFKPARLSKTIIYSGEAEHPDDGRYIHVLGYQNQAASPGLNVMIIPIPSAAPMGPSNAVDMRGYSSLFEDLSREFELRDQYKSVTNNSTRRSARSVQVFQSGSYTVVLGTNVSELAEATANLAAERRPELNTGVLDAYAEWYPGWQLALCIWEGAVKAEPLLWWYEPLNTNTLFYPGLDAHDGNPPNLDRDVARDHMLLTGSTIKPFGRKWIGVPSQLGPAKDLIPHRGWGLKIDEADFNRDYRVDLKYTRQLEAEQGTRYSKLDMLLEDLRFDYYLPPNPLEKVVPLEVTE